MLARITYGLVVVALGCLIGGFFTRESNVLLFISIGLSVVAIALVLVGWARRAREAPVGFDEDLAYAGDEDTDLDELAFVEDRPSRARRTTTTTASRPKSKPKAAKPKAKPKAKPAATTAKRKPAAAKAKAKAKPKAKPKAAPKRKPPRPRTDET